VGMNAGCLQFVVEEDWSDGSESEMKPIMASHSLSPVTVCHNTLEPISLHENSSKKDPEEFRALSSE
jgi:hypothetical protein